ncbi:NUDIX domain-containing protein [Acinetobacter sp. NIPH 1852]|uniref:nucleotide triphosphate diphosphatase NUDT15 n=1 Tax=Acinetobacter sp. NIPH 1852 TaxID=2923428 RepID=UPI001F4A5FE6|nr:NUDIX domain-containing protein [Acinetobacter sp. NIPH 1852]MCH7307226.1 NUDIX domain-containing protein [Acinetobacter sp. NIPH 1852]
MAEILMASPIIGVGIMILDMNENVLLGLRVKSGEEVSWCFPGGKIDIGETFEQSAVRETFEETGLELDLKGMQVFTMFIDRAASYTNTTVGLMYKLNDSLLKETVQVTEPDIFQKWDWFSLSNLPCNLFPQTEAMLNIWKDEPLSSQWVRYLIKS